MLKTDLARINKFFILFIVVMAVLSGILIYSMKTIFSSFLISSELDAAGVLSNTKVNEEQLNQAYDFVFNKNPKILKLR